MQLLNTIRFSQLSASRQTLVRIFQATNYGYIEALEVRHGEPLFSAEGPTVFADIRLDSEEQPRAELDLTDFALSAECCRLVSLLDQVQNGRISKIEVRAGLPRKITLEKPMKEVACREAGRI